MNIEHEFDQDPKSEEKRIVKFVFYKGKIIELDDKSPWSIDPFSCPECIELGYCRKRLEAYYMR